MTAFSEEAQRRKEARKDENGNNLPPGWEKRQDKFGKFYYKNLLMGGVQDLIPMESCWGYGALTKGWLLCFDEIHRRAFFFHSESTVVQWEFPRPGDEFNEEQREAIEAERDRMEKQFQPPKLPGTDKSVVTKSGKAM